MPDEALLRLEREVRELHAEVHRLRCAFRYVLQDMAAIFSAVVGDALAHLDDNAPLGANRKRGKGAANMAKAQAMETRTLWFSASPHGECIGFRAVGDRVERYAPFGLGGTDSWVPWDGTLDEALLWWFERLKGEQHAL